MKKASTQVRLIKNTYNTLISEAMTLHGWGEKKAKNWCLTGLPDSASGCIHCCSV